MIDFKSIRIEELEYLAHYFLKNKNSIEKVVKDCGSVETDNEHGTLFLKHENPLFKVFWIYIKENKIVSFGFGGQHLGLMLDDLYSFYGNYNEGFIPYDGKHVYVFYISENVQYSVKIYSSDKLFDSGKMIKNVPVNSIEITLL